MLTEYIYLMKGRQRAFRGENTYFPYVDAGGFSFFVKQDDAGGPVAVRSGRMPGIWGTRAAVAFFYLSLPYE